MFKKNSSKNIKLTKDGKYKLTGKTTENSGWITVNERIPYTYDNCCFNVLDHLSCGGFTRWLNTKAPIAEPPFGWTNSCERFNQELEFQNQLAGKSGKTTQTPLNETTTDVNFIVGNVVELEL